MYRHVGPFCTEETYNTPRWGCAHQRYGSIGPGRSVKMCHLADFAKSAALVACITVVLVALIVVGPIWQRTYTRAYTLVLRAAPGDGPKPDSEMPAKRVYPAGDGRGLASLFTNFA